MLDKRLKIALGVLVILSACTDYEEKLADRSVAVSEEEMEDGPYYDSDEFSDIVNPDSVLCGAFKDSRDNRVYKAVKIGSQIWMAENLSYDYRIKSSSYGNQLVDSSSLNRFMLGRLYTWAAAMDSAGIFSSNTKGCGIGVTCSPDDPVRGVCPKGWHVPSEYDYQKLFNAVGGENVAAAHLKSTTGWVDYHGVVLSGNDEYHFSVYPDGNGEDARFWTSSKYEYDSRFNAQSVSFYSSGDNVSVTSYFKDEYKSVRCVADDNSAIKDTVSCSAFGENPVVVAVKSGDSKYDSLKNTLTDLRDNQTYKTVTIGTQVWMAENLNFKYEFNLDYGYRTIGPIVYKNYNRPGKTEYGRYYTWTVAMDSLGVFSSSGKGCGYNKTCTPSYPVQGVCPKGWHLPSAKEWDVLFSSVGGKSMLKLKSVGGSNNSGGPYGFSALPAGSLYVYSVPYSYNGSEADVGSDYIGNDQEYVFLTSTEATEGDNSAYVIKCSKNDYADGDVCETQTFSKDGYNAVPVRCLRDEPAGSYQQLPKSKDTLVSGVLTDSRDGQTYKYVTIGSLTWMAENLNYNAEGSHCFADSVKYCDQYGRLYTWASAMDSAGLFSTNGKSCGKGPLCAAIYPVQGICPEGWHLPSDGEWHSLFFEDGDHGKMFKSKSGWGEGYNGSDDYGFSALPAGYAQNKDDDYCAYYSFGSRASFWSSTENRGDTASYWYIERGDFAWNLGSKDYAFSVRCVRNVSDK